MCVTLGRVVVVVSSHVVRRLSRHPRPPREPMCTVGVLAGTHRGAPDAQAVWCLIRIVFLLLRFATSYLATASCVCSRSGFTGPYCEVRLTASGYLSLHFDHLLKLFDITSIRRFPGCSHFTCDISLFVLNVQIWFLLRTDITRSSCNGRVSVRRQGG